MLLFFTNIEKTNCKAHTHVLFEVRKRVRGQLQRT